MSCDSWVPLLLQAAERGFETLADIDQDRLSQHLADCDDCRQALDDQRSVQKVLRAREDASVPVGFVQQVRVAIEASGDKTHDWLDVLRWRVWSYRLAPLAAGLVLVAVLTADSNTAAESDIGWPELAAAWAFGDSAANGQPAFTVWGRDDFSSSELLDTLLSNEADTPLYDGDQS